MRRGKRKKKRWIKSLWMRFERDKRTAENIVMSGTTNLCVSYVADFIMQRPLPYIKLAMDTFQFGRRGIPLTPIAQSRES